jgi:RNA methyltransferase, TrmH family
VEKITSTTNPKIKKIVKLQKASERREQGVFIIEGFKEITFALEAGYTIDSLFYCPDIITNIDVKKISAKNIFEITREVFAKIAYREGSDGMLAIVKQINRTLKDIKLTPNPFIIVIEAIEKPGNLGAILRTADASKADAVIIADPRTDIYNPNVIRSSVGCVFTTQVVACTNQEVFDWLKKNNISVYAAALHPKSETYFNFNYTKPTAIVLGTEADGLTDFWLMNSDEKIIIPMLGKNDSLNVSNAAAILAYEVVRQRQLAMSNV